jgi:hypothetical protein
MPGEADNKNTGTEGGEGGDQAKDFVTKQELAAMVTGAVKRATGDLDSKLTKVLGEIETKLSTSISEQIKFVKEEQSDGKDKGNAGKPDPAMTAMSQKVNLLETRLKESETKREEAETRAKLDSAKSSLRNALQAHVRPEALDMATDLLFDARKRVSLDDSGRTLFSIRQAAYPGMTEEDMQLPLADGIAQWLKSDEAKLLLPAPGGGHKSGSGPQKGQPSGQNPTGSRFAPGQKPTYDKPPANDAERLRRADEMDAYIAQQNASH